MAFETQIVPGNIPSNGLAPQVGDCFIWGQFGWQRGPLQQGNRVASGAFTIGQQDIGGVIHCTGAGAQACALPSLAAFLIPGTSLTLTFVHEAAATLVTITPGAGQVNNGASLALTAGPTGRRTIYSRDGLNWFG